MNTLSFKLDDFEGPLDLLLFLIAKDKMNINDISILHLVNQYIEQIRAAQLQDMDIASEFVEMAARLIYLKTVSLLPKHEEAEDLKKELTVELMEYEYCRRVAKELERHTDGFDTFVKDAEKIEHDKTYILTHEAQKIKDAYISAVGRGMRKLPPPPTIFKKIVAKKIVSVSSKIIYVLKSLSLSGKKKMRVLFEKAQSRSELVATFLALLELCKSNKVYIYGEGSNAEIKAVKGNGNDN